MTLPFVFIGLTVTLLFAQREGGEVEEIPRSPLDRGAAAVLLYPVLLVSAVALVNVSFPALPLTAAIAMTVAALVLSVASIVLMQALLPERPRAEILKLAGESLNQRFVALEIAHLAGKLRTRMAGRIESRAGIAPRHPRTLWIEDGTVVDAKNPTHEIQK